MRYLLLSGLVWFLIPWATLAQVTNQRLFDITPFIPEHYARRVAQFEQEPVMT